MEPTRQKKEKSRPTSHCKSGSALRVFLFQHKMLFESIPNFKKEKGETRAKKKDAQNGAGRGSRAGAVVLGGAVGAVG